MAAITQDQRALPGRRYGLFTGKPLGASATTHPVARLTQQMPFAGPGRRYGAFGGKTSGGVLSDAFIPIYRPRRR